MKQKKFITICIVMTIIAGSSCVTNADVYIDFDAVALRPANDGSGEYGTIVEYADGTGVNTNVPKAGQKVYYGTDYFNGWSLSDIAYIDFTYKRPNGGNNPYTNIVITDGSGNFGVISSQGGYVLSETIDDQYTERAMRYYFAGNSGNQAYGFRFYEPSPDTGSWGHGTNLVWSDIAGWSLLGVGAQRPISSGESAADFGDPRAPVDHALAIMWGDSAANYLGIRDIYNVSVVDSAGTEYVVVPVPAAVILGIFGLSVAGLKLRKFA